MVVEGKTTSPNPYVNIDFLHAWQLRMPPWPAAPKLTITCCAVMPRAPFLTARLLGLCPGHYILARKYRQYRIITHSFWAPEPQPLPWKRRVRHIDAKEEIDTATVRCR